jgi:hypothetical protein
MSAEGCRAAALDRRHDLQLVEAHVAGVGPTPSRAMAAEDIRDLQCWTRHERRALRGRLLRLVCNEKLGSWTCRRPLWVDSDPAVPTTRIGIDEVRGAVPLPVTDGVGKQARLNIGEVVWPVVMPIVAMGAAIVCQYGARPKGEEKTKRRYKSWHVALAFWSFSNSCVMPGRHVRTNDRGNLGEPRLHLGTGEPWALTICLPSAV